MPLPSLPLVVLDTETTGFLPGTDRVFELGLVRCEGGKIVREYESLFSLDQDIPLVVQAITHVHSEDLQGKPSLAEERANFEPLLAGAIIVAHNAQYDIGMLCGEGLPLQEAAWIDTAMLASIAFPEMESWSLGYLSKQLHLPHEPVHRALGDVRATLALLEKIVDRLTSLSEDSLAEIRAYADRGPKGYQAFFSVLKSQAKKSPSWQGTWKSSKGEAAQSAPLESEICRVLNEKIPAGGVHLIHTPPICGVLQCFLQQLLERGDQAFVAVKNLDASRESLPDALLEKVTVITPPQFLLDADARDAFLKQETFTHDELTLAMKLSLFQPTTQSGIPIHSEERDVWKGKIACAKTSKSYTGQFDHIGNVALVDHRHLLSLLDERGELFKGKFVLIDDASMLEDTATKAFRYSCSADPLRAAAEGDAELTSFLDAYMIWLEKVRNNLDVRYITETDLRTADVKGLRLRLDAIIKRASTEQVRERLEDLRIILDVENLEGRIVWIENFRDEGRNLHSVPLRVSDPLRQELYASCRTALIVPPGEDVHFSAIVPSETPTVHSTIAAPPGSTSSAIYASPELTIDRLITRIEGKTVVLIPSKRTIEQLFVKHAEKLEELGITFICQGMTGGQGRMQAEFSAAQEPAVWLITPWAYENLELPPSSVDHLWILQLPFDHPSHAVLSRRSEGFKNPFEDYFLPRMLQRIFRLLRTYSRHRKPDGDVMILDERVHSKGYGRAVKAFVALLTVA